MESVFFFYGLAFLIMAMVIFLMPKKNDLLGLSKDLWLVGLFGLMHGTNEWIDLFILRGSPFNVEILTFMGAFLLPLSFVPLLQFGVRVLFRESKSFRSLKHLWMIPLIGWAIACFFSRGFLIPGIVARYFICLPGAFLAAMGLLRAFLKADRDRLPAVVFSGAISAIVFFALYGIFSGLVVPKAHFLWASFLNYPFFLQMTGLPVQFFRMLCAIFLAFSFFALTAVYSFRHEKGRMERRGGIKRKITWAICGFSCVTAFLTALLFFTWSYHSVRKTLKQEQAKTARTLSYAIGGMIDHEIEDLQVHLSNKEWKEEIEGVNLRYAHREPDLILKDMEEMDKKWIPAQADSVLIKGYLERPMSLRLKSLEASDSTVAEIFITDRYGGLVGASNKTSDFYQADEDWWQKAYAGGKGHVFLGDVALDASSGILSIPMAIPIRNNAGEILGICKESINVEQFFLVLKSYKSGKTGYASLIDEKGNILYQEGIKPLTTKLFSEDEMRAITHNRTGLVRKGKAGDGVTFHFLERLNNPTLRENGIVWYLCISQSAEEIFEPLKQLAIRMGVLLLILLSVTILLGIMIGERFAKPIRELQMATEKIMKEGADYKISIWTGDEIEEFAESFNLMVQRLREEQNSLLRSRAEIEALSRGLEKKVEERTRELSESQRATLNILEDLTETNEKLKKFAEDLTEAKNELELQSWGLQKANDGIKALYQELEKKNADLAKLDQLKDDFVSIVAHELRNPLGVIREAAALVLDGLVGPVSNEQKRYMEMIKQTGDRLIHITTDLLDLAKIESGKIVVNYEMMDFLSMARQACEGIALRANKKGLKVLQVFPAGKLEISGDFDKLLQVMNNLLNNAFKFTEQGNITVEIKDLGEEVLCAVKDTGPGISEENLARLFSKFEQFGKPIVSAEKGSGLGLVISKSIVLAHGGKIWAESEKDKGSAFFFTLPKHQKKKQKLGEILVEEKTQP